MSSLDWRSRTRSCPIPNESCCHAVASYTIAGAALLRRPGRSRAKLSPGHRRGPRRTRTKRSAVASRAERGERVDFLSQIGFVQHRVRECFPAPAPGVGIRGDPSRDPSQRRRHRYQRLYRGRSRRGRRGRFEHPGADEERGSRAATRARTTEARVPSGKARAQLVKGLLRPRRRRSRKR